MRKHQCLRVARDLSGFTVIELLVLIAVIAVLAGVLVPSLQRARRRADRIQCTSFGKQMGVGFKTWAIDQKDRYPMQVSTNDGGVLEFGPIEKTLLTFQLLSNELSTPVVLVCPADKSRSRASNFQSLTASNLSYFLAFEASAGSNWQSFLAGDRNITNGTPLRHGVLELATNAPCGFTADIHEMCGQVLINDGSVQQLTSFRLFEVLQFTGEATNRIALP